MSDEQEKVVLDAPAPVARTDQPGTPSPAHPSTPPGLSRGKLFAISVVLTLLAIVLIFIVVPGRTTAVQRRGIKAEGQVLMKDSQTVNGETEYLVRFVFRDANNRNHDAMNQLTDAGQWESLKPNQYINVFYLPSKPDQAYMEGAVGMAAPHSRSLSFLGWTALVVSIPFWYMAFKSPRGAGKPASRKAPIITRR